MSGDLPPSNTKAADNERRGRRRAVVLIASFAQLLVSAAPYRQYVAAKHRIRVLERREAVLDRQIEGLEAARERLGTDAEAERLARMLGFVRPGEVPFVVVGGP